MNSVSEQFPNETGGQLWQFTCAGLVVPLVAVELIVSYSRFVGSELSHKEWKTITSVVWLGGMFSLGFALYSIFRRRPRRGSNLYLVEAPATTGTPLRTLGLGLVFLLPGWMFLGTWIAEEIFNYYLSLAQWKGLIIGSWLSSAAIALWILTRTRNLADSLDESKN